MIFTGIGLFAFRVLVIEFCFFLAFGTTHNYISPVYNIKDIVKGDSIFCATGITSGDIVKGITIKDDDYISETFDTHKSTKTKKKYSQKNKINQ